MASSSSSSPGGSQTGSGSKESPAGISGRYQLNSHLVAGVLGGLVPTISLYPLELVKTRMQVVDGIDKVYSSNYSSLRTSFRSVLTNEGVKGLYKGLTPAVLAAAGSWGGYFYFYEHSKNRKLLNKPSTVDTETGQTVQGKLGTVDHLLSGVEAGSILVMMFNPIWLIKTRLALQGSNASAEGSSKNVRYRGMLHAGSTIVKEEGVKGLYKGLVPALLLTSHGAVQFAVYEYLKKTCRDIWEDQVPAYVTVGLGGASKFVASIATYPYQVIKSRLQQRGSAAASDGVSGPQYRYRGISHCFRTVLREEGVRGFFRGVIPNSLKVAPSASITFVVYEEVVKLMK